MSDNRKLLLVVAALLAAWLFFGDAPGAAPPRPIDLPADAPDFAPLFASNPNRADAREHAARLADLCQAVAEMVEYDGRRTEPRLTSSGDAMQLRVAVRDYLERGSSYEALYPGVGRACADFLDGRAEEEDKPLSEDATRAELVTGFLDLAKALRYAADQI